MLQDPQRVALRPNDRSCADKRAKAESAQDARNRPSLGDRRAAHGRAQQPCSENLAAEGGAAGEGGHERDAERASSLGEDG